MSYRLRPAVLVVALAAAGCGSDGDPATSTQISTGEVATTVTTPPTSTEVEPPSTETPSNVDTTLVVEGGDASSSFTIEIWADNWMAVSVNGALIGEDSVPITAERSFNAETFPFTASYPFTVAIEAKDFKETDSGIEYIGEGNQQMGDGGLIAQITDTVTGKVVAVTDSSWQALVVHRAPLNTDCEKSADPDASCLFEIIDTPAGWTSATFDDSAWTPATIWTAAEVSPKDGYDEISWDGSAKLIWGTDLKIDNTVLLRRTITG